jgi:hypothetical protein
VFGSSKYAHHCGNVGEHHPIEMLICDEALSSMSKYAFLVSHFEEEEGTTDTAFHLSMATNLFSACPCHVIATPESSPGM